MGKIDSDFYKVLFEDLDVVNLRKRFLGLLLKIQNVERGSIWVKQEDTYECIESLGGPSDTDIIKGASIGADQSSIVGWVIENGEMTVAEAGKDPRHYKGFEEGMKLKSARILCFPLILRDGRVYGAVQVIETNIKIPSTPQDHSGYRGHRPEQHPVLLRTTGKKSRTREDA